MLIYVVIEADRGLGPTLIAAYPTLAAAEANLPSNCEIQEVEYFHGGMPEALNPWRKIY